MFLSFILMNMENFCKGGGDGFRRFNGVGAAQKKKRRGVLKYTLFTKNEKPENRQSLLSRPKSETYK